MARGEGRKGRRAATGANARISSDGDVGALLPVAVHHHQAGDLDRARLLYEQIIAADPLHADGLQYFGILCGQCGDAARAESLIRRAIAVRPDVAPYHDNLGTVLEHSGQFAAALAAYEDADRLEPGLPERAYNLGLVLERLGCREQAADRYRQGLARDPRNTDCLFALANLRKATGALDEAMLGYRAVLAIDPAHVAARINLGNALQDSGEVDAALTEYRAAIARSPDNPAAYHNQGRALLRSERPVEAQQAFEQALRCDTKFVDARLGLAQALERQGRFDRAYAAYRAVCRDAASDAVARSGLLRVARIFPPRVHDELLVDVLLRAIAADDVKATSFARVLGVQLAAKAGLFESAWADDNDALQRAIALERDALFVTALEGCINVVPEVERWLCAARRALLQAGTAALAGREPLLRALALQCVANEFVFEVTDGEIGVIDAVLAQLAPQGAEALCATAATVRDVLLCACYMPLTELWGAVSLASAGSGTRGPWLDVLIDRAVAEPLEEQAIAGAIAQLAALENAASIAVRAQYEEHPYPRWRELAWTAPGDGNGADVVQSALDNDRDAAILVAGCGTGHEPLLLAKRYPGAAVTALDLSRASLAYARRMAIRFSLDHVEFMQGDLLDVARLGRTFQVITASGVLHHLADPLAGWRALLGCLREDGVMKVALYSRRARAAVNAARGRIAALELPASAKGVRALRARILAGTEPQLASLLESEDFYTTSVCRDLLFHPVEHQFDLNEIAAMLDALDLQFAGFELPHPLIRRQFLAARLGEETSLAAWDRFEQDNPQTFAAMYVMWCRRKRPDNDGAGP